jgi:hypothetical protein
VSLHRRSASGRLSTGWLLPSPQPGIGLMSRLTCGTARPVVVGWHGRRQLRLRRSEVLRSWLSLLSSLASLGLIVAVSSAQMPAEHLFSLVRRLSGTDQGVESGEGFRMGHSACPPPAQYALACAAGLLTQARAM